MRFIDRSTHMVIRLSKTGCVNRPFYLITVQRNRAPRDRKIREQIGSFDPLPNMYNERLVAINFERLKYWLANGASTSKPVAKLLGYAGYFPVHPSTRLHAWRLTQKQEEEANKNNEEDLTASEAT